ncbi:MAG: DUF4105 domain-containing protein [Planctomycetota bacterium]
MSESAPKKRPVVLQLVRFVPLAVFWLLAVALWFIDGISLYILSGRWLLAPIVVAVLFAAMLWKPRKVAWTLAAGIGVFAIVLIWRDLLLPRNDRTWWDETAVMPVISVHEGVVTIDGVRNFTWDESGRTGGGWETRTYALDDLQGVDLIVQPFPASELMAHTMLSFDFGPGGRLMLSIEARKQQGENYSPVAGALNQFELIYIFLDERDALTTRAITRGDRLHAYPTRNRNPATLREFFVDLCESADGLRAWPRFYHIIFDNCTTVWIRHVDAIANTDIGLRWDTIATGRIARFLHMHDSIDTDQSYDEAKDFFRIDEQVRAFAEHPEFSRRIREQRMASEPE